MIEWITATRWRMPAILLVYFALHVVARSFVSPSLDYDESEQVFLSQYLSCGYNSQPPLYTWVQTGFFELLGYSVFSLAVLKNLLLCGTFLLVFASIFKATGHRSLGVIAALGLMTIPQIAWESHRDLSHTVLVTFATALVFYSVVSLAADGRSRWYVLIGVATALGILSKYNFAIVILAMTVAGLTVPMYRNRLLDRRMWISVGIAAVLILPHAIWMGDHLDLISSKTMTTLTTNQSNHWFQDVRAGFTALAISTFSCCAITLATYFIFVVRRMQNKCRGTIEACCQESEATTWLLERFLISVTIVLCLLVLSGHALEFKNRWLQPFVVLVPAYLVMRLRYIAQADLASMNRLCAFAFALMFVIITAVVTRPMVGSYRNNYCWLNVPYQNLATAIHDQVGDTPTIIVASDMRIAGNLRLHFPQTRFISQDQRYLADRIVGPALENLKWNKVVVVTDRTDPQSQNRLIDFMNQVLHVRSGTRSDWQRVDVPYLYGTDDACQRFLVSGMADQRFTRTARIKSSARR